MYVRRIYFKKQCLTISQNKEENTWLALLTYKRERSFPELWEVKIRRKDDGMMHGDPVAGGGRERELEGGPGAPQSNEQFRLVRSG